MKNLLILFFLSFSFFSCTDKEEPQPIVKEVIKTDNKKEDTVAIVKKEKATENKSVVKTEDAKKTQTPSPATTSTKKKVTHSSGKSIFIDPVLTISTSDLDHYFTLKNSITKLIKEHDDFNSKSKLAIENTKVLNKELIALRAKNASQNEIDAKAKAKEYKQEVKSMINNASKTGSLKRRIEKTQRDLKTIIDTYSITE
ncbi:hypothetical protein EI427_03465 [Flammeovirga pectinis]|uniref:Uncharacterized protein n=1 Tax=Flammeovirga pectinis TaxID=2494373 RepID=A0A3Q9FM32_9BACT|nr:hypothetical protein [Flammeovirga pectinis]AZQ61313.1 hypothetical protein EI427_03465 [Flammeovirga pectinis]